MRIAVVYSSRWGNSQRIAQLIARELSDAGHDVSVMTTESAVDLDAAIGLLVVGSGTRMGKAAGPAKKFIKRRINEAWAGKPFAAFGTGLPDKGEEPEPKGADDIYSRLESVGLNPLAPAFKATVTSYKGPLAEGEAERATAFGRELASKLESID